MRHRLIYSHWLPLPQSFHSSVLPFVFSGWHQAGKDFNKIRAGGLPGWGAWCQWRVESLALFPLSSPLHFPISKHSYLCPTYAFPLCLSRLLFMFFIFSCSPITEAEVDFCCAIKFGKKKWLLFHESGPTQPVHSGGRLRCLGRFRNRKWQMEPTV